LGSEGRKEGAEGLKAVSEERKRTKVEMGGKRGKREKRGFIHDLY